MSATVKMFQREDGLYDWRLRASNGEELCGSMQGYTERNDAEEGYRRVVDLLVHELVEVVVEQ